MIKDELQAKIDVIETEGVTNNAVGRRRPSEPSALPGNVTERKGS